MKSFPDREGGILERGHDFGESRVVCDAYWYRDVVKGKEMGKATLDCLRANAAFNADLELAREEVFRLYNKES